MSRDDSPLNDNEVKVDYLDSLKSSLRTLKSNKIGTSTPDLYLGLLGEFGFAKWLTLNQVKYEHKTVTKPDELKEDFQINDTRNVGLTIGIDIKTSGIRPPHSPRIISVEQFQRIPDHSSVLVWTFYSSWRNSVTIDSWTWVNSLMEARLKAVTAPPDIPLTNDPALELDFTEMNHVYEIPSFLMRDIEDLKMRLKGFNGGLISD
jgi:hypothetical protein